MATTGIDATAPAPRVNFEQMSGYVGRRVRLVGKVESIAGNVARVTAADGGAVEVRLRGACPADAYIEVDGVVESPGMLNGEEGGAVGFGASFDMANYNELCKLINGPHKALFF
jgi:hypothetical protein